MRRISAVCRARCAGGRRWQGRTFEKSAGREGGRQFTPRAACAAFGHRRASIHPAHRSRSNCRRSQAIERANRSRAFAAWSRYARRGCGTAITLWEPDRLLRRACPAAEAAVQSIAAAPRHRRARATGKLDERIRSCGPFRWKQICDRRERGIRGTVRGCCCIHRSGVRAIPMVVLPRTVHGLVGSEPFQNPRVRSAVMHVAVRLDDGSAQGAPDDTGVRGGVGSSNARHEVACEGSCKRTMFLRPGRS